MSTIADTTLEQPRGALDEALRSAESAATPPLRRAALLQAAQAAMDTDEGMRALADRIEAFLPVFEGGPWQDPARLAPPLVGGGLKVGGPTMVIETLSELRMLALAQGGLDADRATRQLARRFLDQAMALNLDLLFPSGSEEERLAGGPDREVVFRLFRTLCDALGLSGVREAIAEEIELVSAQRPIITDRLVAMVEHSNQIPKAAFWKRKPKRLREFAAALAGPTPWSAGQSLDDYADAIRGRWTGLEREAHAFADSMWRTGLVSPHHAVFLREHAADLELFATSLGFEEKRWLELRLHEDAARELVEMAIFPSTAQCLYGLARTLQRGLLSRQSIDRGLQRLMHSSYDPELERQLAARLPEVPPRGALVAGTLAVLGQPLGVGQGNNPTCQSARGISLWAGHAPEHLLSLLISAARQGEVEMPFEGVPINSSLLVRGVAERIDMELDPVSIALVPHLDRIYDEMMRRAAGRGVDPHRWVNPAFYGQWVPRGFAASLTATPPPRVTAFDAFVRRFYATHHPDYDAGFDLMHPNPVGLFVTASDGALLGAHAVSVLRVGDDPVDGHRRLYFFNPNNEGRQDWGLGVQVSVSGHGEQEGESSLPFDQFAARLYAFHFEPGEIGDEAAVPDEIVASVTEAARQSWGRAFVWEGG